MTLDSSHLILCERRMTPSKATISPGSKETTSPTTTSWISTKCFLPSRCTVMVRDSFLASNTRNCRSFCQSFKDPTKSTTMTATRMATPSTQSTGGAGHSLLPGSGWTQGCISCGGVKSVYSPNARETIAAIINKIRILSWSANHINIRRLFDLRSGNKFAP